MFLAPNGKESNLTPEQYKLVRTPEFKAWFGDWENDPVSASKVVDENGEPLVVYHGTTKDFNVFDKSKQNTATGFGDFGAGFYFTSSLSSAKYYTLKSDSNRKILNVFLNIRNPFTIELNWEVLSDESKNKYEKLKGLFNWQKDTIKNVLLNENDNRPSKTITKEIGDYEFQDILIRNGYDGVFVNRINIFEKKDVNNIDQIMILNEIISFEPEQIKLANGTNTTFDSSNPDIRFKKGGRTISQTPAPKKDRIKGSKVNPKGSASSEKSATEIKFDAKTIIALNNKLKEFRESHSNKNITLNDLKAVYRRGLGAYSTSHRPNITRGGWAMARVNAFLKKAGGGNYKKAYVQDDDLLKYADGGLIAPNGKKSNLTPEQYKLVRTPEFKAWFGDWENNPEDASKVVDENNEPLVCYHGSRQVDESNKFNIFNIGNGAYGEGIYFTSNKKEANGWALGNYVYQVFLSVKNPFIENNYKKWLPHKTQSNEFDGIIKMDINDVSMAIAFEPTQIKLADGSNTTFNANNPDIRYADGGEVGQDIKCRRCGWEWNTSQSEVFDKYVCHNCGFDNRTFYDVDPIGYANGGLLAQQGTLYTKDKNKKLEYYKKGNDYAFKVYDVENNTNENEALMNYNQFINYLYSELYIDEKYVDGGEVDKHKETYAKWKSLVNMSKGELEKFYNSQEGKDAGLSTSEANEQGISSGRESARMIMKMKDTPKDKWTDTMWKWANKQISFISRMSGMKGELYDDKGNKTRKHTSLLIWGHNPKKSSSIKFENGGLIAPNGKPSNLTPEQYALVRTPEFKAWFGDWEKLAKIQINDSGVDIVTLENLSKNVSKVVDINGEPLVCYHGSNNQNIGIFDIEKAGTIQRSDWGKGIYFTPSKSTALYYSAEALKKINKEYNDAYEQYEKTETFEDLKKFQSIGRKLSEPENPIIYEVFLNIRKPLVEVIDSMNFTDPYLSTNAMEQNKDGVFIKKSNGRFDELIAFKSNQIKLADGNNTTFDSSNPDIRYELGGTTNNDTFKNWFGNSKVVDKKGNPLIVYHGSPDLRGLKSDYIFKTTNEKFGNEVGDRAYFFTDSYSMAKSYADPKRAFDYQNAEEGIMPLYLSLQKPLIVDAGNQIWRKFETEINEEKIIGTRNLIFYAQSNNFDGVIVKNVRDYYSGNEKIKSGGNVYVAFNPNQIKLADGTNVTFDMNNPDIRFADGGEMDVLMQDTVQRMDNPNFADLSYYKNGGLLKVYHYTNEYMKDFSEFKDGVWVTTNSFGYPLRKGLTNKIESYINPKELNFANEKQVFMAGNGDYRIGLEEIKNQGFDGVKRIVDGDKEFYIFDNSKFKKMKNGGELQGLTKKQIDTNLHNIATQTQLPIEYINSQLKLGIKFEMEHTNDKSIASKIALDHLNESPYYYQKLTQMENELKLMESKKNVYLHDNNNSMSENTLFKQGGDLKYDSANVKEYFAHGSGNAGGVLVGKRHSEGGIKAVNKSTGQPLEMEGGEVVITRKAVSDDKKREFEGEMLTNKEILSRINESGGGVKIFSEGGDIESDTCSCSGKSYKYGGKMMIDYDIAKHIANTDKQEYYRNLSHKSYETGGVLDLNKLNATEMHVLHQLDNNVHNKCLVSRLNTLDLFYLEDLGMIYSTPKKGDSSCYEVRLTEYGKSVLKDIDIPNGHFAKGGQTADCGCGKSYADGGYMEKGGITDVTVGSILLHHTKMDKKFGVKGQYWKVISIENGIAKIKLCDIKGNLIEESRLSSNGQLDLKQVADTDYSENWKIKKLANSDKQQNLVPLKINSYKDYKQALTNIANETNSKSEFFDKVKSSLQQYIPKYFSDIRRDIFNVSDSEWTKMIQSPSNYSSELENVSLENVYDKLKTDGGNINTNLEYKYFKGIDADYKNQFEINKAIEELVSSIPSEQLTAEEKNFIGYFSGYGGLEKYGATGKGLLYEYFTPSKIAKKMWALAYKHGFKGGKVLEPSCGIGEFIKYAPEQELVSGYEINEVSAKICKILYPKANIESKYFETFFIKNNNSIRGNIKNLPKFSLVIGNPPYGYMGGIYAGMGEKSYTKSNNYIDYFINRGLDLLEKDGLLIYIIGTEVSAGGTPFLMQQMNEAKKMISNKANLLDAYRLPNGLFDTTDVVTDIIVLQKK